MQYLLSSDWHLQYSQPIARTDNFIETQIKTLKEINELAKKYDALHIVAGDITDNARESKQNEFIQFLLENMIEIHGVGGNHGLLYKSLEYLYSSTIGVLEKLGLFVLLTPEGLRIEDDVFYGYSFGEKLTHPPVKGKNKTIAVWHQMVFASSGDDLSSYTSGLNARNILTTYPDYDIILTGDNHKTFVEEYEGRYLINPGSLFRLTAAQIDHKPCVFLYDSDTHELAQIYLNIDKNAVTREHLDKVNIKNDRMDAFVQTLENEDIVGFSFNNNMEKYFHKNNIKENVKKIIYKAMEEVK